jgi:hypothetical protein
MIRATHPRGWLASKAVPRAPRLLALAAGLAFPLVSALLAPLVPIAPLAPAVAAAAAPVDTVDPAGAGRGNTAGADANVVERASEGTAFAPELAPRGSFGWPRVCSSRHDFCVRPSPGTLPALTRAALRAGDRAWDAIAGTLRAPPPEGALGDPWQVYLVDGVDGGGRAALAGRDPRSAFDRAASFALVDRATPPGCTLDFVLARAIAGGGRWRAAPASDAGSALGAIDALAHLATPCAGPDRDAVLAFQDAPESCIVAPAPPSRARGDALFFEWLDGAYGKSPGAILLGLWSLAPTRTAWNAPAWAVTPSGFDVLAVSLGDPTRRLRALDDVFLRFAVARASMDPPAARAWRVPWPSKARRLLSPRPLAPGGASYVVVDREGAGPESKLRVEAEWEDYARLRWIVLKLDAAGRVLAQIPIPSLDAGTHTSLTVDNLAGVDRVLLVTANLGSTEHPFDPQQGEWEPHGWLLTLGAE